MVVNPGGCVTNAICCMDLVKSPFLSLLSTPSPDWESSPVRVLHTCEGAVWRRGHQAGGSAPPLVQHGNHAGAARDAGEHQGGDPTSGECQPVRVTLSFIGPLEFVIARIEMSQELVLMWLLGVPAELPAQGPAGRHKGPVQRGATVGGSENPHGSQTQTEGGQAAGWLLSLFISNQWFIHFY